MPVKYFKQVGAAERFRDKKKKQGFFASVFEEPVDPQASTRRKRAQRRYYVEYDRGNSKGHGPNPRKPKKNLFGFGKGASRESVEQRRLGEAQKLLKQGRYRQARKVSRMSPRKFARRRGIKLEGSVRGAVRRGKDRARARAHTLVDKLFGKNPVPALVGSLGSAIEEGLGFAAGGAAFQDLSRKRKRKAVSKKKTKRKNDGNRKRYILIVFNKQGASDETEHSTLAGVRRQIKSWGPGLTFARIIDRKTGKETEKKISRNPRRRKAKNPRRMKRISHAVAVGNTIVATGTHAEMKRHASNLRKAHIHKKIRIGKRER